MGELTESVQGASAGAARIYAAARKTAPEVVVDRAVAGLRDGRPEVLADGVTTRVRVRRSGELGGLYPSRVAS